jgi:hypothetical protein
LPNRPDFAPIRWHVRCTSADIGSDTVANIYLARRFRTAMILDILPRALSDITARNPRPQGDLR